MARLPLVFLLVLTTPLASSRLLDTVPLLEVYALSTSAFQEPARTFLRTRYLQTRSRNGRPSTMSRTGSGHPARCIEQLNSNSYSSIGH